MYTPTKISIENKQYSLALGRAAIREIEDKHGSLMSILSNINNIKISLLYDVFGASFKKYHGGLSNDEIDNLCDDYVSEKGIDGLQDVFESLLMSSGLTSKPEKNEKN